MTMYTCAHCGAQFEVSPFQRQGYCEYCGTAYGIDQSGAIMADPAIIRMVKELIDPFCELEPLENKTKELEELNAKINKKVLFHTGLRFILPAIYGIALWVLIAVIGKKVSTFFIGMLVGIAVFGISFLINFLRTRHDFKTISKNSETITSNYQEIDYYKQVLAKYDLSLIPACYRNRDAMGFISHTLETGGASSLVGAFQAYERELQKREQKKQEEERRRHEREMERMRQREIELHNQQLELERQNRAEVTRQTTIVNNNSPSLGDAFLMGVGHEIGRSAGRAASRAAGRIASHAIKEIIRRH